MHMTPDDAYAEYQRHPQRQPRDVRAVLVVTGGILSSIAGAILILLFFIIT
jgi:hypothetical protein